MNGTERNGLPMSRPQAYLRRRHLTFAVSEATGLPGLPAGVTACRVPPLRDKSARRATKLADRCRLVFGGIDEPKNLLVPTIDVEPQRAKFLFHLRRSDIQPGGFDVCGDGLAKTVDQVHPAIAALKSPECEHRVGFVAERIKFSESIQPREV